MPSRRRRWGWDRTVATETPGGSCEGSDELKRASRSLRDAAFPSRGGGWCGEVGMRLAVSVRGGGVVPRDGAICLGPPQRVGGGCWGGPARAVALRLIGSPGAFRPSNAPRSLVPPRPRARAPRPRPHARPRPRALALTLARAPAPSPSRSPAPPRPRPHARRRPHARPRPLPHPHPRPRARPRPRPRPHARPRPRALALTLARAPRPHARPHALPPSRAPAPPRPLPRRRPLKPNLHPNLHHPIRRNTKIPVRRPRITRNECK